MTIRRRVAIAIAVATAAVGLATWTTGAQAATPPGGDRIWGVQPSTADGPTDRAAFDYVLGPGEAVQDWVGVTNHGAAPITLRVYASDAFTTEQGGFDLLPADEAPVDVGSWITMESPQVVLGPGERADVPFTLTVPANATPGDHAGGIVASFASDATAETGAVVVDQRVGARVYLRVDGPLDPTLTVDGFRLEPHDSILPWAGTATVTYTVRNTGNVRLSGRQQLDVAGVAGVGGASPTLDPLPELLPGAEHDVRVDIDGVWSTGRTEAELTITPVAVDVELTMPPPPVVVSTTTTSVPWALLAVLLVIAVAWWARRRRRRRNAPPSTPDAPPAAAAAETVDAAEDQPVPNRAR